MGGAVEEEANDLSQSCAVKKRGFFRRALLLTMRVITPLMLNVLFATRVSECSCGLGVGVELSLLAICLGLRVMLWNMRLGILRCQIRYRVIPCQINTKKYLTSQIWTKLGSYIVPVETFTHSQFQCYMLYGFRVRASQKVNFSPNFGLPLGT